MKDLDHRIAPVIKILKYNRVSQNSRFFGSFLIVLSGTLLYLDKVLAILNIEGSNTYGFSSFSNFTWNFMQTIAPVIMILAFLLFKPYKISFTVPVFCYSLQAIWIFGIAHSDQDMQYLYSGGLAVLYLIITGILKYILYLTNIRKREQDKFVDSAQNVLEMLKVKILEKQTV